MKDLKYDLLLGSTFGLLLFVAERSISGRVHMGVMPAGKDLTLWLLATASLYLAYGVLLGALCGIWGPIRRRPGLVPHLCGAASILLAVVALPNWTGILMTAGATAIVTALLWLPRWRRARWYFPFPAAIAVVASLAVSLAHPRGMDGGRAIAEVSPPVGAPDLIVVVLDTVRRDRVSAYGYPRDTTPAFDELARRGARLDRAYVSSPWSLPSHVSMFTGLSPGSHGAHYEHPLLEREAETLAVILREHGYRTVGISGNPWLNQDNGSARGFDLWHDSVPVRHLSRCFFLRAIGAEHLPDDKGGAETAAVARDLVNGEDQHDDRPLFLFVNVFEAHSPYDQVPRTCSEQFLDKDTPRREVRRISDRLELAQTAGADYRPDGEDQRLADAVYDGAVRCADDVMARVLDEVDYRGAPAVIVALSDHGESLGEHDLVGHHHGLYDLLIRVPMAVSYPPEIPPGTVVDAPVRSIDIMPTLLDYADVPRDRWPDMEGVSVRPLLTGADPAAREREAFAEHYTPVFILEAFRFARPHRRYPELQKRRRSVVHGDLRYEVDSRGQERLHDLARDPSELDDLVDTRAEAAHEMRTRLAGWITRTGGPWGAPPDGVPDTGLDEDTLSRLRALGYVQ